MELPPVGNLGTFVVYMLLNTLILFSAQNDYIASVSIVTFQPSDVELTIAVTLVNDDQVESSESFTGRLVLQNNQERVQIAPDTVTVTIAGGKSLIES